MPQEWPNLDVQELLSHLTGKDVDFVVIGGIAVIIYGSARFTRDLDICFASDPENLEALGQALVELKAGLRGVEENIPFVPDGKTLAGVELLTLTTSAGWLDVHRVIEGGPSYEVLRRNAERADLGDYSVLVASIDDMIAMKRAAGRPRDFADIAELEAIQRLRERQGR